MGPIYELTNVFLSRSSSQANVGFRLDSSSHLVEIGILICYCKRDSYAESWWMKVARISRSGRLLFKNSRLFNRDHLYLRMM